VRTETTGWGDLNIEFALRDGAAAQTNRAAALEDVLAIVRAVYAAADPRDWVAVRSTDLPTPGVVRWLPTGVCQAWRECGPPLG